MTILSISVLLFVAMTGTALGWAFSACSVYTWAVRIRLQTLARVTETKVAQWKALPRLTDACRKPVSSLAGCSSGA